MANPFGGKGGFGKFSENDPDPDEPMERIVLVKQEAHVYKIPANQVIHIYSTYVKIADRSVGN